MPTEFFKNTNTLCHAVQEVANIDLTARPYNRFEPDNTTWWLINSTEWPAYRQGKIFFQSSEKPLVPTNKIYCGFSIEKGIDSTLVNNYYGPSAKSLVLEDDWFWFDFLEHYSKLPLQKEIVVSSAVHFNDDSRDKPPKSVDEQLALKDNFKPNVIKYILSENNKLTFIDTRLNNNQEEISNYYKTVLEKINNMDQLIEALKSIPLKDWVWIDFYNGIFTDQKNPDITVTELWNTYLKIWHPWLRKRSQNS